MESVVDGYGSGYGDGSGYGSGYGDGYGSGDGSGYGSGDGSGYGSGSGYRDGSGYGDGSGDGSYLTAILESSVDEARLAEIKEASAMLAFWRSDKDGKPANGGSGSARQIGIVEELPGPLKVCTKNALHATLRPWDWKGTRLWVVALYPPWQEQDGKYGSLKREILAEITPNPFPEIR